MAFSARRQKGPVSLPEALLADLGRPAAMLHAAGILVWLSGRMGGPGRADLGTSAEFIPASPGHETPTT